MTNMISVIRINIVCLQTVLIKQPGPASQYRMQVSNSMFKENFLFWPSKANSWRFKNIHASCNRNEPNTHKHLTNYRCQTRWRDMPINSGIQNFVKHGLIKTLIKAYFWIISALEVSTLLKIPPYNTTWSALLKHEWSNKKDWETEQRKANEQINVRGV